MAGKSDAARARARPPRGCGPASERGVSSPMRCMASRKSWRSSAMSMASARAPIISTPNSSRTPRLVQLERGVERGLSAHGGQQRIGALGRDDLGDDVGRDGLDVGGVGQLRVGHDRRRIGVDQNDPVALGLEGLAGLRPRVVELAGLADDDGSGPDDEDGLDIRALGHEAAFYCRSRPLAIAQLPRSCPARTDGAASVPEEGARRYRLQITRENAGTRYWDAAFGFGASILRSTG